MKPQFALISTRLPNIKRAPSSANRYNFEITDEIEARTFCPAEKRNVKKPRENRIKSELKIVRKLIFLLLLENKKAIAKITAMPNKLMYLLYSTKYSIKNTMLPFLDIKFRSLLPAILFFCFVKRFN